MADWLRVDGLGEQQTKRIVLVPNRFNNGDPEGVSGGVSGHAPVAHDASANESTETSELARDD
ncbi:MAG: hypothetical protein IKK21_06900 [Clostridia bacterium]|nr:hypothetical protein [Clostridia bacterium]